MMKLRSTSLLLCVGVLACAAASAQTAPTVRRIALPPRTTAPAGRASPSPALIVQGGISPDAPCSAGGTGTYSDGAGAPDLAGRSGTAIGPKQDDPAGPRPTDGRDAATGAASGTATLAIGPKQDDPAAPKPVGRDVASGMASGRGALAIGPKQDDPAPPPPATGLARCAPAAH